MGERQREEGATVLALPLAIAPRTFMPCSSLHALMHLHITPPTVASRRHCQWPPCTPCRRPS